MRRNTQDVKTFAFPEHQNDIAAYLDDQYTTINMNQSMEQKFNSVLEVKRPTSAFLNSRDPRHQLKHTSNLQASISPNRTGIRSATAGSKSQSLRVQQMLDAHLTDNQTKLDTL